MNWYKRRVRGATLSKEQWTKDCHFLLIAAGLLLSAQPLESQEFRSVERDACRAFLRTFYGRLEGFAVLLLPTFGSVVTADPRLLSRQTSRLACSILQLCLLDAAEA